MRADEPIPPATLPAPSSEPEALPAAPPISAPPAAAENDAPSAEVARLRLQGEALSNDVVRRHAHPKCLGEKQAELDELTYTRPIVFFVGGQMTPVLSTQRAGVNLAMCF